MPFALVTIGLIMIVTGARDTYKQFGTQITEDFTGSGGFLYWIAAIGAVGALGYVPSLRTFSRVFMGLIIVAMVLRNGGFFDKLQQALQQGPSNIQSDAANGTTGTTSTSSGLSVTDSSQSIFGKQLNIPIDQYLDPIINNLFGGSK